MRNYFIISHTDPKGEETYFTGEMELEQMYEDWTSEFMDATSFSTEEEAQKLVDKLNTDSPEYPVELMEIEEE